MHDVKKLNQDQRTTYVSDRRQWSRTPGDGTQVKVWTTAREYQIAEVCNESLTGLALLVEDVSQLSINREVRLTFPDRQMWAIVKHIQAPVAGKHEVGLAWGCSEGRFLTS